MLVDIGISIIIIIIIIISRQAETVKDNWTKQIYMYPTLFTLFWQTEDAIAISLWPCTAAKHNYLIPIVHYSAIVRSLLCESIVMVPMKQRKVA